MQNENLKDTNHLLQTCSYSTVLSFSHLLQKQSVPDIINLNIMTVQWYYKKTEF
jgi:hypothetical protein